MVTLETLRGEKRAEILRVAEAHGARNVRVFCSVVRGDNRDDSDVDLLVEFEEGNRRFSRGLKGKCCLAPPPERPSLVALIGSGPDGCSAAYQVSGAAYTDFP